MKLLIFLLLTSFSLNLFSQKDTTRERYSNGQLKYECPMLNGEYNGVCREWYNNGQLRMITNWKNGQLDGLSTTYYYNGSIHIKQWHKEGVQTKYTSFHTNGKKRVFYTSSETYKKHILWNSSGQMIFMEIQKGLDQPVSDPENCNCGNENVSYRDSMLIDRAGNQVSKKVQFKIVEWYENGKMKSEEIYQNGKGVFRSFDMNGVLIKEEKY